MRGQQAIVPESDTYLRVMTQQLQRTSGDSRMAEAVNPYGDGKAAERIVQAVLYHYGLASEPPQRFSGVE